MDYRERIKKDEGLRFWVYRDTEGNPTVGWGHLLPPGYYQQGVYFTPEQCDEFFEDDMQVVEENYLMLRDMYNLRLDYVRRGVLKNMLFNLGLGKLLNFKKMLTALRNKDYPKAAAEMLDSKWAAQVKGRATRLAKMMEIGKDHA